MPIRPSLSLGLCSSASILMAACLAAHAAGRQPPQPRPSHPGNVFLAGEQVSIPALPDRIGFWQAVDYDGKVIADGPCDSGSINLGKLPVGYYEVIQLSGNVTNRRSIGVLAPLKAPTPLESPISTDAAAAWLVPPQQIAPLANLCALAGINWVRDRLNWEEMEPARGQFAASNRYDFSIQAQAASGLRVLEVSHRSPRWANNTKPERFPLDLRDVYEYSRVLAKRWQAQVPAFEPWNEADIDAFGGHTGNEMASLQKAAYLGLKAGNPKVIACLNVFALHRRATLDDLSANEAWAYFDTFNLHHYEPFGSYPQLYADFRAASAGKPLWVTECSLPVKWTGDARVQEPTARDLLVQSERVAKTYALALHEGANNVFYFILPHFVEGPTQFGLLRPDLTPRPAYLALAAVGRLLADAQPLGRLKAETDQLQGFAFSAKPDGQPATVLVLWSEPEIEFNLPERPIACFDHLGRRCGNGGLTVQAGRAPHFVLLAKDHRLPLIPSPAAPKPLPGKPTPVVMQVLMPESRLALEQSAYRVEPGKPVEIPFFLYNFGTGTARGRLTAELPEGWSFALPTRQLELRGGERKGIESVVLEAPAVASPEPRTIQIHGDFGRTGKAVLSLRFLCSDGTAHP